MIMQFGGHAPPESYTIGSPTLRTTPSSPASVQNLYWKSTPIVRGWLVDTRVRVGCCHAKTVLSIVSAASLLVRLVPNRYAPHLGANTPVRKSMMLCEGRVSR